MKLRNLSVCVLLAAPAIALGANREIQELQRDIGLLQQQIKDLQRSQDEKLATVMELARQSIDLANKANASAATVTRDIEKTLGPLKESLAAPIAALNATTNATSNDVRALQQAVADLGGTLARMQSQMDDMKRLIQTMQTPVAPPQPAGPGGGNAATGTAPGLPATPAPSDTKPSMSALDLYQSSLSDFRSQKYDLALQGFADFLRWYPMDKLAVNSQFYIGMIHYNTKNYDQAVQDFDNVLEHYIQNPKTEEAMLYKARSLVQIQGRRSEGAAEYKQLIKEYPKSEHSKTACDELKNLGMNCTVPAGSTPRNTTASKRPRK
jgi:tol-pal system protein YbgF